MSRDLTAGMQAGVAVSELRPYLLLAMHFSGGTEYRTTCYKPISFGGNTFLPSNILSIGAPKESLELRVPTLSVTLSGVNQANISTALIEGSLDRVVQVWRCLLDSNEALVVDPVEIFKGRIDAFSYSDDEDSASLSWDCVSHLADFERVAGRRANDAEQQFIFSGDRGFEFAALVSQDVKWGRA